MSIDTKIILESIKETRSKTEKRKFVQSIDLVINLRDIDINKPENKIQERIELPYPIGKQIKVCVIASGELASKARKVAADLVIERSELEALAGDRKRQKALVKEYTSFVAEAPLMSTVGRVLGAVLGPKGRMPTPVAPTANIADIIEKQRKTVLLRLRGKQSLQIRIGSENMPDDQIAENIQAILRRLEPKLKRGIKNISSMAIKASMGSPIEIKI